MERQLPGGASDSRPESSVALDLDVELTRAVRLSSVPALVMTVPGAVIVAASEEAARLVGVSVDELVGRNANDFAVDEDPGVLELVHAGSVSAFESTRLLRRGDGAPEPLQVWVRAAADAPVELAVVVLWPRGQAGSTYLPVPAQDAGVVVGSVDERLQVKQVSNDAGAFGADSVLGSSFLRMVAVSSAADVLRALADSTSTGRGLSVAVRIPVQGGDELADLLVRPTQPPPSFVFALVRGAGPADGSDEPALSRMGRGLHALSIADVLVAGGTRRVPGLESLTARELDVVARVLAGDRVPVIAAAMFITQSTVRNHLSNVFRKLRIRSQQDLIELFRDSAFRLPSQVRPPMA